MLSCSELLVSLYQAAVNFVKPIRLSRIRLFGSAETHSIAARGMAPEATGKDGSDGGALNLRDRLARQHEPGLPSQNVQ